MFPHGQGVPKKLAQGSWSACTLLCHNRKFSRPSLWSLKYWRLGMCLRINDIHSSSEQRNIHGVWNGKRFFYKEVNQIRLCEDLRPRPRGGRKRLPVWVCFPIQTPFSFTSTTVCESLVSALGFTCDLSPTHPLYRHKNGLQKLYIWSHNFLAQNSLIMNEIQTYQVGALSELSVIYNSLSLTLCHAPLRPLLFKAYFVSIEPCSLLRNNS